jgi:hypothetical protein
LGCKRSGTSEWSIWRPIAETHCYISRRGDLTGNSVAMHDWLSLRQAQALLNAPDVRTKKRVRDRAMFVTVLAC